MASWKQAIESFLNLFIKSNCPLCSRPADGELCQSCSTSLRRCQFSNPSQFWKGKPPAFIWGSYSGTLKRAITRLKYENQPQLARPLGYLLAESWLKSPLSFANQPVIVPIPMYADKLKQRGFNQAELLAESFCQRTGLPLCRQGLMRVRATEALFGLSFEERQKAVADAFKIGKGWQRYRGSRVLLLDDIYTTGTTVREATDALRDRGVSVYGVVAIATTKSTYTGKRVTQVRV